MADDLERAITFAKAYAHMGSVWDLYQIARDTCRTLVAEVERLRAESAREHAAWEAVRSRSVMLRSGAPSAGEGVAFSAWGYFGEGLSYSTFRAADPVDAVLAVVEAGAREPERPEGK